MKCCTPSAASPGKYIPAAKGANLTFSFGLICRIHGNPGACARLHARFERHSEAEPADFSDAPWAEILAANAITKLLVTFQHEYSGASLGDSLPQGRASEYRGQDHLISSVRLDFAVT